MNNCRRLVDSLFVGLCIGILFGSFYGWINITMNADMLRGINDSSSEWGELRMGFEKTKALLLGLTIGAFTTIVRYFRLSYADDEEDA